MFQVLEHPADIGFRAQGRTLSELFESAAEALVFIALDPSGIAPLQAEPIEARGEDLESLLVNYLNEVLWRLDGRRFAMRTFRVLEITHAHIRAVAHGEPRDPARHPAKLIVKGVTYHQLRVAQDENRWSAQVFLDI